MDCAADCTQVRCQAPAKLALQQVPQQVVRLQAAHSGRAAGTAAVQVFHRSTTQAATICIYPGCCLTAVNCRLLCQLGIYLSGAGAESCAGQLLLCCELLACNMWHPLKPASHAQVLIGNQGSTSLAVSFGLERRNDSVLAPLQWLNPASGYQKLFTGLQGSCGDGHVRLRRSSDPDLLACPMGSEYIVSRMQAN